MTIKVKLTADISRPIELAYTVATNVAQLGQWAQIKAVRKISSQPVKVGTTFQILSHLGGEDRLIDCKVTVLEPNRKFVYVSGGLASSEVVVDLRPAARSCTLTYTVSVKINPFIEPLIKGEIEQRARADLARLVKLIEAS